jgi:hypothetical protein
MDAMPSPFPGMDPYLEGRAIWPALHTRLIVAMADALGPRVRPHYRVEIELRAYLVIAETETPIGRPDALVLSRQRGVEPSPARARSAVTPYPVDLPMPEEIIERFLEVRDVASGEVVTVMELLSPANKLSGEGRRQYERKRMAVLGSQTNLVEIDLLRVGEPPAFYGATEARASDYRILVSRALERPRADAYLFGVRDPIPDVPVPLAEGDEEPILPLNQLLRETYERAGYDLVIDYGHPSEPPLRDEDATWARELIASR